MNAEIRRVAFVALTLIGALVVGTTYWQAWAAGDLAARQDNAIKSVAQFKIKTRPDPRGRRNGARREPAGRRWTGRRSTSAAIRTAHSRPTSSATRRRRGSRAGLERSLNDYLTGSNGSLRTVLGTKLDALAGKTIVGNSVVADDRPRLQRAAQRALERKLRRRRRARAVHRPRAGHGDVTRLRRQPGRGHFAEILGDRPRARRQHALLNRATAGLYAPGSTFKLVTAAAALDTGKVTPDTSFTDRGYCIEYGKPVYNYDTDSPFGGGELPSGAAVLDQLRLLRGRQAARRDRDPRLRRAASACTPTQASSCPATEQRPSGLYQQGQLFFPKQDFQVDPGRLAFGQERLGITPSADGDGRVGDRQRRRAHAALSRPAHPRTGWEGGTTARAERGRARDETIHRPGADGR